MPLKVETHFWPLKENDSHFAVLHTNYLLGIIPFYLLMVQYSYFHDPTKIKVEYLLCDDHSASEKKE